MLLTFLAQADPAAAAKGTVSLLQTILTGGPALILACLVVVEGYIIYRLYVGKTALEEAFRKSSESLLREQLTQSEPLIETLTQTKMALKSNTEQLDACMKVDENLDRIARSVESIERMNNRFEANMERLEVIVRRQG
jgi:predicted RecB family endonuclease